MGSNLPRKYYNNMHMLKMTEVYYYNNKQDLQKLEMYNISSSEFLRRQHQSGFKVFCMMENGSIIYASADFRSVEDDISALLTDLISQPN